MGARFVPVESFDAEVNGIHNSYIKGAVYTVHDTPQHLDLAVKCRGWAAEGLVIVIGETDGPSLPGHITQHR